MKAAVKSWDYMPPYIAKALAVSAIRNMKENLGRGHPFKNWEIEEMVGDFGEGKKVEEWDTAMCQAFVQSMQARGYVSDSKLVTAPM